MFSREIEMSSVCSLQILEDGVRDGCSGLWRVGTREAARTTGFPVWKGGTYLRCLGRSIVAFKLIQPPSPAPHIIPIN